MSAISKKFKNLSRFYQELYIYQFYEEESAAYFSIMIFREGDLLSVLDGVDGRRRNCKVVSFDAAREEMKIHYIGWKSSHDEVISVHSDRIGAHDAAQATTCENEVRKKEVIGGLLLRADDFSKQVLSAYSLSENFNANEKNLSKFSVAVLEGSAVYLKVTIRDSNDKKLYNKKGLTQKIVMKIDSLMPTSCVLCSSWYKVGIDDNSFFSCHCCMRGSHDCNEMKKIHSAVSNHLSGGIVWLCSLCQVERSSSPAEGDSVANVVKTSEVAPVVEVVIDGAAPPGVGVETLQPISSGNNDVEQASGVVPGDRMSDPSTGICRKYRTGSCPHESRGNKLVGGGRCPYQHPRRCKKYCDFGFRDSRGCDKGRHCNNFHPILCRYSLRNKKCLKVNCTFVHLREAAAGVGSAERRNEAPVSSEVQSSPTPPVPSPSASASVSTDSFLRLEKVIMDMNQRYDRQYSQLKSQLDLLLNPDQTQRQRMVYPEMMYHHQLPQYQQRTMSGWNVYPPLSHGQREPQMDAYRTNIHP